jgi:hypothetical protein
MNRKLLALSCVLSVGASGLVACGGTTTMDAGTDTGTEMVDTGGTPVDAPSACGTDGLPCLAINRTRDPANMACTPTAPTGADRAITFNLIKRGASSAAIAGDFEIWTNNTLGATCAGDSNCVALTAAADGNVMGTVPGSWYAYRVPQNAAAGTFPTVGYNRAPAAAGGTDTITALEVAILTTALGGIRMGISRDLADGIILGDMADCDGEGLAGVTTRLFRNDGTEVAPGTAATDMGLAYRAGGVFPVATLRTTDESGGYAAANVPLGDGIINIVTYGTLAAGGDREVIGCEQVSVGMGVVTILSLGPLRSDYPAGSYCEGLVTP